MYTVKTITGWLYEQFGRSQQKNSGALWLQKSQYGQGSSMVGTSSVGGFTCDSKFCGRFQRNLSEVEEVVQLYNMPLNGRIGQQEEWLRDHPRVEE